MKDYIVDLLKENNRLIIPNLGAFIKKEGASGNVVFNEFLKYNDNVLINYIAEKEAIEKEEVEKRLEEYVQDATTRLNQGDKLDFGDFGYIIKEKNGRIVFHAKSTVPLEKEPPREKKEEPKKTQETKKEEKPEKEKPAADIPTTAAKETKKSKEIKEEKPGKKAATEKDALKAYSDIPKFTQKPRSKSEGGKTGWIWLLLVIVVGALIGLWFLLFAPDSESKDELKTQDTISAKKGISERPEKDTANLISEVKDSLPQEGTVDPLEQAHQTNVKKYYVVAGCFQYEDNAVNYAKTLREKGFDAEKYGKYGGLHAVSFDAFDNMEDAQKYLNKIAVDVEPNAWVHYY